MGAAFAIQVKTGREQSVKKLVEWVFARNEIAQRWVKAVHAFTQRTAKMLDDTGRLGKQTERPVIPGYIFIEMNYAVDDENCTAYLPHQLWHVVKSVPGVLKLFANAGQIIGAETFRELFERIEPQMQQEQVEIAVAETTAEETKEMVAACTVYNAAESAQDKRQAEQTLKRIEKMHRLYKQALERLGVIYRNGRNIVRVPQQIFEKTVSRITQPIPRPELIKRLSVVMIH
jgi:transcription antitermination factor NusG